MLVFTSVSGGGPARYLAWQPPWQGQPCFCFLLVCLFVFSPIRTVLPPLAFSESFSFGPSFFRTQNISSSASDLLPATYISGFLVDNWISLTRPFDLP